MLAEATRHFLSVGDTQEAARVIEQEVYGMLRGNACVQLLRLLDQLPENIVMKHPRLCLARACCLLIIGQREAAASLLHAVELAGQRLLGYSVEEDELQSSEQPLRRTDVAFFHVILASIASVRGDTAAAVEQAHIALHLLPQEEHLLRGCVLLSLGIAERLQGSTVSAVTTLAQASRLCFIAAFPQVAISALTQQASLLVMQGHLHQAVAVYRYALQVAREHGAGAFASLGEVYVDLGRLLYEWNDLEAALDMSRRGLACGQQWELLEDQIDGVALMVHVLLAQGRNEAAAATLHEADTLFQQAQSGAGIGARVTAIRAGVAWHQGQLEQAARWMQESGLSATSYTLHSADPRHEFTYLILVRILLSQGRLEEAASLLEQLLAVAQAEARTGGVIEILSLQALVLSAQGRLAEAPGILMQALSLAAPEGYIRLFIEANEPMRTLLLRLREQQTQRSTTLLHYIDTLLAAFASPQQEIPGLLEPLSQREREILRLVAQGLSNQQIAQQLVIAMSTVKTHIHHLLGKLAASSRLQAVSRAKALGLLK
ncbi:tetratricopeptide repeat protein [Ktedonosporobacter rubrisoli]|uniref:Tetratricopeptide repeat protein n=1 Tax=Ktedonosporobacter rubrisoli TaxID=2509675 RepID=A0A4P6K0U0_KTERU|nr:LuxR C-terminal-related transcriptional regulator [Ktedonosporobacter rubrisoli]QBD81036.1 tetratricopeptide repeat protein [Ktedonosporobacter rubrisoli]